MIEKELKYIISEKDFLKLKKYFDDLKMDNEIHELKNIYFDSENLSLLNSGVSLRLRHYSNKNRWVFTYKCSIKGKLYDQRREGTLINEELSENISEETARKLLDSEIAVWEMEYDFIDRLKEHMKEIDPDSISVKEIAEVNVTRRKYILKPYNIPVELDEIIYKNGKKKEYEIESETDNLALAESVLMNFKNRLKIELKPSSEPKIIRTLKQEGYEDKIYYKWI